MIGQWFTSVRQNCVSPGRSSDLENNKGREIICSRPLYGQSHGELNVYIVRRPLSSVVSGRHDGRAHKPTTPIKRKKNDPDDVATTLLRAGWRVRNDVVGGRFRGPIEPRIRRVLNSIKALRSLWITRHNTWAPRAVNGFRVIVNLSLFWDEYLDICTTGKPADARRVHRSCQGRKPVYFFGGGQTSYPDSD